jgi:hypothetical protein
VRWQEQSDGAVDVRLQGVLIDLAASGARCSVQPARGAQLSRWSEGQRHTLGAYDHPWR